MSDRADDPHGDHAGPSIELGQLIAGRYRLIAIIGEGGTGRVYQAIDEVEQSGQRDQKPIALKILTPAFDETHFAALSAQFGRWRRLRHPTIVKLFDYERSGSVVFVTMEYLAGESVYLKLHQGGRRTADAARLRPGSSRHRFEGAPEVRPAAAPRRRRGLTRGEHSDIARSRRTFIRRALRNGRTGGAQATWACPAPNGVVTAATGAWP
jgi:hypothetical protein